MARRAFSFAELMCGVVILLLLTGVSVTWYQDSVQEAKLALAKVEVVKLADAITAWQTRTRAPYASPAPPPDFKALRDDPWGQPYRIDVATRTVASSGPDGAIDSAEGGDDVKARWAEMPAASVPVAPETVQAGVAAVSGPPSLRVFIEPGMPGRSRLRIEARSHGSELAQLTVGERVFPLRGQQQTVFTELKPGGTASVSLIDRSGGRATTDVAVR